MQRSLAAAIALWSCPLGAANPPIVSQDEIAHLSAYLASSNCEFYRNGSWYVSSHAADHLKKKYQYLLKKRLVPSIAKTDWALGIGAVAAGLATGNNKLERGR